MLIISNLTIVLKKDLRTLIKDFSFVLNKKDKVGIIGEEGNGKSSLLKVIYNPEEASKYLEITGNISIKDEKIGYLPQMIDEEKLNLSISELLNKEIDYSLLDYKKYYLYIDMFHLDEDKLLSNEIKVKSLSGGERIKLFLLIELMKEPTTLLLDEPSNDLDLSSLNLLEELIKNIDMPVMFISHDESLLSKCANKIIHIESLKSKSEPRVTFKSLNYDDYFTSREDFLDKNIQEYKKDKENFEKKMDKFNKVYQSVNYALNTVSRSQPGVAKNLKDKMHSVKSMEKRYAKEKETLTQKYEVEENMTWRVLGLSEDENHILLTSENPMRKTVIEDEKPYLILQGAEAYIYCEDTLDKICSIYDNTELADEVRSIKIEDINRVLGVELGTDEDGNEIVYQKDDSEKTNIDENGTLGEIYEYKEGDYAPENYVIDMAKKEGKSIVGITEKKVGDTIKGTAYYYDYYTNSQFNISQKAYWLASPSITADSYVQYSVGFVGDNVVGDPSIYTGLEMFNSFGEWNAFSLAVRPVISLKADVTEKQIRKAENQNPTVDEWTYINTEDMAEGTIEGEEGQIKEPTR